MKTGGMLQVIFSLFLGLVVVAFVGIAVMTFMPRPIDGGTYSPEAWESWNLRVGITMLICATLIMVLSLVRAERQMVLSNGFLFGGLFTMLWAVGSVLNAGQSWSRLLVIAVALAVTVALGYLKFARGQQLAPVLGGAPEASAHAQADRTPPAEGGAASGDLAGRVAALERTVHNLRRALSD